MLREAGLEPESSFGSTEACRKRAGARLRRKSNTGWKTDGCPAADLGKKTDEKNTDWQMNL